MKEEERFKVAIAGGGIAAVEAALAEMRPSLPPGLDAFAVQFRQADFIATSIRNVERVLLEAAAVVAVVLLLFLMHELMLMQRRLWRRSVPLLRVRIVSQWVLAIIMLVY